MPKSPAPKKKQSGGRKRASLLSDASDEIAEKSEHADETAEEWKKEDGERGPMLDIVPRFSVWCRGRRGGKRTNNSKK